ncbi:GNAT family N-acetyltransferase [Pacificoceanicola onchidii]|uniref:GNAT family N-acetyltransferase n=1 Tax=Pacificoceanicola onchidii TaxID=2562685 RepID=UPI0010A59E26|nr:GNAT family N-acetyltransferase [Pacificoceanicola onchidii]
MHAETTVDLIEVSPLDPRAITCLEHYYAELATRLDKGFEVHLSADPEAGSMIPPKGSFLIATQGEELLGCVGLKGTSKGYAEVKRLWVSPQARGLGLARTLMAELESRALALGHHVLRLDSNSALQEAIAMYRKWSWAEINRFNEDPYPDVFFEKKLSPEQ